jgi:cytochrome c oxidase cbb3-type subunit III
MPTKVEKDVVTGTDTTGHEWDGIKELNTPLPKWWVYVFWATVIWSVVYYVLYPSVPWFTGYFKGVLGYSQRVELDNRLKEARAEQAKYLTRIKAATPAVILKDNDLRTFAIAGGRSAFAINCAPCHGPGGGGRPGAPVLADDDWLWGGTIDQIYKTIRYGIRSGNDEGRSGDMPAFGADNTLKPDQIAALADYVLSLSGKGKATEAAKALFAENCASCHGATGKGNTEVGAPNLTDAIWFHSGTRKGIIAQITKPAHGVMPAWTGRLSEETIKMLAVYVHSLGGGK